MVLNPMSPKISSESSLRGSMWALRVPANQVCLRPGIMCICKKALSPRLCVCLLMTCPVEFPSCKNISHFDRGLGVVLDTAGPYQEDTCRPGPYWAFPGLSYFVPFGLVLACTNMGFKGASYPPTSICMAPPRRRAGCSSARISCCTLYPD